MLLVSVSREGNGTQSQEFNAIQPAFWDLYAGKLLFLLKADKNAGSKTDVYTHGTMEAEK